MELDPDEVFYLDGKATCIPSWKNWCTAADYNTSRGWLRDNGYGTQLKYMAHLVSKGDYPTTLLVVDGTTKRLKPSYVLAHAVAMLTIHPVVWHG